MAQAGSSRLIRRLLAAAAVFCLLPLVSFVRMWRSGQLTTVAGRATGAAVDAGGLAHGHAIGAAQTNQRLHDRVTRSPQPGTQVLTAVPPRASHAAATADAGGASHKHGQRMHARAQPKAEGAASSPPGTPGCATATPVQAQVAAYVRKMRALGASDYEARMVEASARTGARCAASPVVPPAADKRTRAGGNVVDIAPYDLGSMAHHVGYDFHWADHAAFHHEDKFRLAGKDATVQLFAAMGDTAQLHNDVARAMAAARQGAPLPQTNTKTVPPALRTCANARRQRVASGGVAVVAVPDTCGASGASGASARCHGSGGSGASGGNGGGVDAH